jgi:SAM-dependent methyltransferase
MAPPRYDSVAAFYEAGFSDVDPITEALLTLLGPVEGCTVLDLACGHGRVTRELARRRAGLVVGVDLSGKLIERAEAIEAAEQLGVTYLQADAASAEWCSPAAFDAAICSFGLSDIDDLPAALGAVARGLRPGGRFAFSILHPCFAGSGSVSGAWPTDGTYYDERWWTADGAASSLRARVGANHRMLSTYLNALVRCGLEVDELLEPAPEGWTSGDRLDAARYPVYLLARCHARPRAAD